jgi:hypothetical protein
LLRAVVLCFSLPLWPALLGVTAASAQDVPAPAVVPESLDRQDPCRGETHKDAQQLDRVRQGVFTGVCSTSRWFDNLFGDARDYEDTYDETYGRVGLGVSWDELDDVQFDGHFRGNFPLPALGSKFNAVIGRETEETFIDDNFDDVGFLPGSFSDDGDADWYAGINYNSLEGTNSRFDISAGLQVKSPLNPYVKARYRYYLYPADGVLITTRTTAFWENEDGFGLTLAVDSDWSVSDSALLRWANTFTRSEATEGLRWKTRLGWYQALSDKSAMRYEGLLRGETAGIQPDLKQLKVTYRRSVWRRWFFVETFGGVFWADDEEPSRRCDACAMVGVGFELMFGERYDSPAAAEGQQEGG